MDQVKTKTFIAALSFYPDDIRKMKSFLEDNSLTKTEKAILESLFLLRDAKLQEIIDKVKDLSSQNDMNEHQIVELGILKFEYFFKLHNYQSCSDCLNELKGAKKFYHSANLKSMRVLLNYLWKDERIYLNDQGFKEYPLIFLPIKVILSLEAGEHQEAFNYWKQLKEIEPSVYGDNFEFKGGNDLFSLCLEKLRHKGIAKSQLILDPTAGKEQNLVRILAEASGPVKKEEIYELLWGGPAQDKNDYAKLNKMVCKMKDKTGLNIISRKGFYFINKEKISKAS